MSSSVPRKSASAIIMRIPKNKKDFEVLMIRRKDTLSFGN